MSGGKIIGSYNVNLGSDESALFTLRSIVKLCPGTSLFKGHEHNSRMGAWIEANVLYEVNQVNFPKQTFAASSPRADTKIEDHDE